MLLLKYMTYEMFALLVRISVFHLDFPAFDQLNHRDNVIMFTNSAKKINFCNIEGNKAHRFKV